MNLNTLVYERGTVLYRGSANRTQQITKQMWFAKDIESAKIYGYVSKYKLTKPIVLLKMDEVANILKLTEKAASLGKMDVVDALAQSFKIVNGNIIRASEAREDKLILNFICSLGLEGFASNPLRKNIEGTSFFHAEIGLCDAREYVVYDGSVDVDVGVDVHAFKLREQRARARQKYKPTDYTSDDDDDVPIRRKLKF